MTPLRPFWMRRLLPVFGLLLAANLLGLAVWTVPHGLRQRHAAARAKSAREEAARLREQVAELRGRAAAIRSNGADLERFYKEHAGSRADELVETLSAIEAMARAPGLKPGARSIARVEVEGAPLERVEITLPLEGSYAQLVGFLREVEGSARFLTVEGIALHAARESGAALQVDLSTYFKLAPGAKAGRGGRRRAR